MVFSSNVFLFLFLPAFLAVYYLVPNRGRWRNWVVLLGSYAFYAWWRVDFLCLFIGVTLWNYCIGMAIAHHGVRDRIARRWLILGVVGDLATLGYFKYANFGVGALSQLMATMNMHDIAFAKVILPIGISFYTFESISYISDVYRGDTEATRHPIDFATFVALFPHLIAGPVFRYKDMADQFEQRRHSMALFGEGALRFMQGFIKKIFLADTIALLANHAFSLLHPTTADAWFGTFAYTFQLYFDFSGYSDMAIGLGLMMGFRFVENFNQPYISQSITELWRRWNMSLSSWLRDYLYIPLGGNRHGTFNTYRNLFLTMVLGGFWHGANWNFLAWGGWHGTLLCIERAFGVKTPRGRFSVLRWAPTFLFTMLGWVLFRANGIGGAWQIYKAMFSFDGAGLSPAYATAIDSLQLTSLALAMIVATITGVLSLRPRPWATVPTLLPATVQLTLWPMFAMSILLLEAHGYSPFLYFQF